MAGHGLYARGFCVAITFEAFLGEFIAEYFAKMYSQTSEGLHLEPHREKQGQYKSSIQVSTVLYAKLLFAN